MNFGFPVAVCVLGGLISSCADPTEVVVFVDTSYGVPCQVDTLRLTVTGVGDPTVIDNIDPRQGVQSVALSKSSGTNFDLRLEGVKADRVVASAVANIGFVEGRTQSLGMVLGPECAGTACDFSQSVTRVDVVSTPNASNRISCSGIADRYEIKNQTGLLEIVNACTQLEFGAFQDFPGLFDSEMQVTNEALTSKFESGFDFFFFGNRIQTLWVSDDGFLHFNNERTGATLNAVTNIGGITAAGHPSNAVLAFWDNINLQAGGRVCVGLKEGQRDVLWVTWDKACLGPACASGDDLVFSVGLEEVSQRIIIAFDSMRSSTEADRAAAGAAVVGIIGAGETGCESGQCDAAGRCGNGAICNFAEAIAREIQTVDWPAIYVFDPLPDE